MTPAFSLLSKAFGEGYSETTSFWVQWVAALGGTLIGGLLLLFVSPLPLSSSSFAPPMSPSYLHIQSSPSPAAGWRRGRKGKSRHDVEGGGLSDTFPLLA
uniref:Uncharacterized protein n=1 Tax=Palpitomonas bilix TaxID=652834 RepID=A0A7S3D714_9EUKA|mmetsp:Transcript_24591/g.62248  ORF Transcript_24591/g.62248 Transcript_24591/m.62248 type:complete len:100 (+) Transcript_24591:888-1187(+)